MNMAGDSNGCPASALLTTTTAASAAPSQLATVHVSMNDTAYTG